MRAFLLAAGFGTRLWPLSDVRAKPAFPYRGRPLIAHVAAHAVRHGATELIVNTHHLPESIRAALADFPAAPVTFVHEPSILGTAGALVNARALLESDAPLVVMNAKIVTDIDIGAAVRWHVERGALLTLVTVPNRARANFTHVAAAADDTLTGFVPATELARVGDPRLFTGISIVAPGFFRHLPPPGFSDTVKDVIPKLMAAGERVHVFSAPGAWAEFSTLQRYRELQGAHVDPSARIERSARVDRSVIWPSAVIGAGARLQRCIVADGVVVPAGVAWSDVAIIQANRVAEPQRARREADLLLAPIGETGQA